MAEIFNEFENVTKGSFGDKFIISGKTKTVRYKIPTLHPLEVPPLFLKKPTPSIISPVQQNRKISTKNESLLKKHAKNHSLIHASTYNHGSSF